MVIEDFFTLLHCFAASVLDQTSGPAHPDGGSVHVYDGPAVPGDAHGRHQPVDADDTQRAAQRPGALRLPDQQQADQSLHHSPPRIG